MPLFPALILLTIATPSSLGVDVDLDDVLVDAKRLVVGEFEVVKGPDDLGRWYVELRRGIEVIARHEEGGPRDSMASFGLFPFLGGTEQQLVIMQYSGGLHCCWSYWIYDLVGYDEPRVIFDSTEYPVGYPLQVVDADNDGIAELRQHLLTFDYFGPLSHADSPFPTVVFAYDAESGRYVVGSHRFPAIVLSGVEAEVARLREWGQEPLAQRPVHESSKRLSTALDVLLRYVYAGQDQQGWRLFEELYVAPDAQALGAEVRNRLEGCRVYRALMR